MHTHRPRASRRLAATLVVAAAVFTALPASADTKSEVDAATKRLKALEAHVATQESDLNRVAAKVKQLSAEVDRRRADAAVVQRRVKDLRTQLEQTEAELDALRTRLGDRARAVYVQGPGGPLLVLFGAHSMSDLAARLAYAARLIRLDADLQLTVRRTADDLRRQRAAETALLSQKAALVKQARREEDAMDDAFAQQMRKLQDLVKARIEIAQLVQRLRTKLRAEQLASAVRAAGRGTPMTFGDWGTAFLKSLGAPQSHSNLVAVVAWQAAEYTSASWNPLATTYAMPKTTVFNASGVRNYSSLQQGLDATTATLGRPGHGYEAIVSSLRSGADAMSTARAINASDWCRGCTSGNYVTGLVPAVEAYYDRYAAA